MSNLLERAIIDAKALKEAALKNAEQLVIEKYSDEVRTAVDQLLEMNENQLLEQEEEARQAFQQVLTLPPREDILPTMMEQNESEAKRQMILLLQD